MLLFSIFKAMHYKWFTPPIEDEPVKGEITWLDKGFTFFKAFLEINGSEK